MAGQWKDLTRPSSIIYKVWIQVGTIKTILDIGGDENGCLGEEYEDIGPALEMPVDYATYEEAQRMAAFLHGQELGAGAS